MPYKTPLTDIEADCFKLITGDIVLFIALQHCLKPSIWRTNCIIVSWFKNSYI